MKEDLTTLYPAPVGDSGGTGTVYTASTTATASGFVEQNGLWYQSGFGNTFESELLKGALPRGRNNPRLVPYQLYTEQLSGTAFTVPRHVNRRTWLYRIQPSVVGTSNAFRKCGVFGQDNHVDNDASLSLPSQLDPNPMRWGPMPTPTAVPLSNHTATNTTNKENDAESATSGINFISGMKLYMSCGTPMTKNGLAIYMYAFDQDMQTTSTTTSPTYDETNTKECMYNSDGDFLIVPQEGSLFIQTELGRLICHVKEICVIPRGIFFSVSKYCDYNASSTIIEKKNQDGDGAKEDKISSDDLSSSPVSCRGYVLEIYGGHFQLPELGPIGSNGLANPRDFLHPTAWCDDVDHNDSDHDTKKKKTNESDPQDQKNQHGEHDEEDENHIDRQQPTITTTTTTPNNKYTIYNKFGTLLFQRESFQSPYNVVAWHGNYVPFKYNLERFCAINSVTYDHLDPSIYTVLTCSGGIHGGSGGANEPLADFVIFPPRIMATDSNTFRPPWFHRNCMTEFMGLISGTYDAKQQQQLQQDGSSNNDGGVGGFYPGGASLHSCMTPHGPDTLSYEKAIVDECLEPTKFTGGLAFMFETSCMLNVSHYALHCSHRDLNYASCWSDLKDNFTAWDQLKQVQQEE